MIGSAMTFSRRDPNAVRRATLHREPKGMLATARHYVGDLVYGANDGLITTFAVVAGVAGGALSSRATLIIGAANLFADGLSMAVGNYLSIRSREGVLAAQDLPEEEAHPAKHGLATLFAFVGAGGVPLLPFARLTGAGARLTGSIVLTFTTLVVIGGLPAWRCCCSALPSHSRLTEAGPLWPGCSAPPDPGIHMSRV